MFKPIERPCLYPLKSFAKFIWVQSALPWSGSVLWLGHMHSPVFQQTFIYLFTPIQLHRWSKQKQKQKNKYVYKYKKEISE